MNCYANHWFFGATTPEEYAEKARAAVAMGYKALKWDPFDIADLEMSGFGNVTLRMAGGRLTGDLSGFGNLEYYGTVSEEAVEKSGLGSIRRRN